MCIFYIATAFLREQGTDKNAPLQKDPRMVSIQNVIGTRYDYSGESSLESDFLYES